MVRLTETERRELNAHIAVQYNAGKDIKVIAAALGIPYRRVWDSIKRSRDMGLVPPKRPPSDTARYVSQIVRNGGLSAVGTLRGITGTLTAAQVDYLLANAKKAETFADAVAVFLALNLPEKGA